MEYTRKVRLDVNACGSPQIVRVKQGDASARFLNITIVRDGKQIIPDSDYLIMFRCEKSDGHAVVYDNNYLDSELNRYLIVLESDGTITVELTEQVMVAAGRAKVDICFIKEEKILSTIPLVLEVIKPPDVTDQMVSTDDFRTLKNLLSIASEIISGGGSSGGITELPIASPSVLGGVKVGKNLTISASGVLTVDTADDAEQDNTRPITSAAVHTIVGNIDSLLATI